VGSATSKVRIRQEPNAVCAYASERYPQPIITRRQDTIARKYFFVMTALPKGITELRGRVLALAVMYMRGKIMEKVMGDVERDRERYREYEPKESRRLMA
jgi:hypothetical protein